MSNSMFKKADFILMAVLIIVGIASSALVSLSSSLGDKVVVEVDGKIYGTYSLGEDKTVTIKDGKNTNIVKIKSGKVSMDKASCRNQLCVHHSAINETGESIICLPNKVVVKIEGKEDNQYDAISN